MSVAVVIGCTAARSQAPRTLPQIPTVKPAVPEKARPRPETVAPRASQPVPAELPTSLSLAGFEPAVLRLAEDRNPAPTFVITHGAGGQADWHCSHYAELLGPAAALLCLRGKRMVSRDPSRGYYYPNHLELADELVAAHTALLEKHSPAVFSQSSVYAGYSQGASMGVLAVAAHGEWWPRLLLVEGGYDTWSPGLAQRFSASGGQRVLLVCGTEHCRKLAQKAVLMLTQARVEAKLLTAPGAGHRPDGPVGARVREGLVWLLGGDPHFENVLRYLTLEQRAEP